MTFNLKPQDGLAHSGTKAGKQKKRDPEGSHVPSTLLASLLLQDGVRVSLLINDNDNNNIVVFLIIQGQYGPSSKIKLGQIHSVPEL